MKPHKPDYYLSLICSGDWCCDGCGAVFVSKLKAIEHVKKCEYIGYLESE